MTLVLAVRDPQVDDKGNPLGDEHIPRDPDGQIDPRYTLACLLRERPGVKIKDICLQVGIGMDTYYKWFPASTRTKKREAEIERIAKMVKMREEGWSDASIAREFKMSRTRVGDILGRRGKRGGNLMKNITWRATAKEIHNCEIVASRVGAALSDGELPTSIQQMLTMIASGQLIVTAPRGPLRKRPDKSSSTRQH